jgi:excisionase family DNA binding protein
MRNKGAETNEMDSKYPAFMRASAFAREIGGSRSWVYELMKQRKIPYVRLGGRILIPSSAIEELRRQASTSVEDNTDSANGTNE